MLPVRPMDYERASSCPNIGCNWEVHQAWISQFSLPVQRRWAGSVATMISAYKAEVKSFSNPRRLAGIEKDYRVALNQIGIVWY